MKKKTKKNISKAFTIFGLIGLYYIIFVDHRPKEYDKILGSFSKFEYKAKRGRYSHRVAKIKLEEHPSWYHLEKNGKSYGQIAKYFKNVPSQTPVTLLIDNEVISDKEHSHIVYQIVVNDSVIFDRMREDASILNTIKLVNY